MGNRGVSAVKCEVKNVQSAEVFAIPPEGMIFGRVGGPADITVPDQSVSKKHARIYLKDGVWLLEDLKSVNGTVVNNRRITEAMALEPGFVFTLAKHQFEIIVADAASAPPMPPRSSGPRNAGASANGIGGAQSSDPRRPKGPPKPPPVAVPDDEPLLPPAGGEPSAYDADVSGGHGQRVPQRTSQEPYLNQAPQGGDAAAVMLALPKAVAYYLAAIPLMALNPLGTIRKGVLEPKLNAMSTLELIAFIIPIQLFANVLAAWGGGIATLIAGNGFAVMSFIPIVPLLFAVVVSVISGFITHPLLRFFIDRLFKGQSDDKTRTNCMIMLHTAGGLLAIPTAATLLLSAVIARLSGTIAPIALLLIIPALLSAIVTPLLPLVSWRWMQAFRVLPIIQKITFVLLILAALGGAYRAYRGVVGAVQTMSAGSSGVVVPNVPVDVPIDTADIEAVTKAKEAAEKGLIEANKAGLKPPEVPNGGPNDGKPPADGKPIIASVPTPVEPGDGAEDRPVPGKGSYRAYKEKRDFIEKAIAEDPALLRKEGINEGYRELSKGTYRGIAQAEQDVLGPKKKFDPTLKVYLEKYKELMIFEETKGTVDKLHKLLNK